MLLLIITTTGCATRYDLDAWRSVAEQPRAESERGELAAELRRVDELRADLALAESRGLALTLVAENPEAPAALFAASRAESDKVFLSHTHEKDFRALAALSALDYARRMGEAAEERADWLGQYAFAMGTSTHLQPMFSRASHASDTAKLIDAALALDQEQPVALATGALLNYRLQTLPWIANVMSVGEPESSLEQAETYGRAAFAELPSMENALILAKILRHVGKTDEARELLASTLERPDAYPRDAELRGDTKALLAEFDAQTVAKAADE